MRVIQRLVVAALALATVALPAGPVQAQERALIRQEFDPIDVIEQPERLAGTDRRNIIVRTDRVDLMEGTTLVWSTFETNRRRGRFDELARVLDQRGAPSDWLVEVSPGVFQLNVGFVQGPGTYMNFIAPAVRQVRLLDRPDVYLAGVAGTARYTGVGVTSWDPVISGPNENSQDPRPYLLYARNSTLDLQRADLGYLGADRSRAYGVNWDSGSRGVVEETQFHHNFFGAYTFEAGDLTFRRNVFHNNAVYGLDPHDYTKGLVVEDNEAYANGSHGIIFSVGCTDGVVRRNYSHDNQGNGIVMDNESDRVLIEDNRVERNARDGIVILGSSDITVARNAVQNNRVGIRVNLESMRNRLVENRVTSNERGIELYGGAREGQLDANVVSQSGRYGLVLEAPGTVSRNDSITGAPTGVEIRSLAHLEDTTVNEAGRGVVVGERGIATLSRLDVNATEAGVYVKTPALARLDGSRLSAPQPITGAPLLRDIGNVTLTPAAAVPWLAVAGLAFIVVALLLQLVHRARNRPHNRPRSMRGEGPEGVWNTN